MWRSTINYGRKGLPLQCISAVDLAIWDLLGKLRNEPVYALLGGLTKDKVPVYCTTARPDLAQQLGFIGAKYPLAYGPADGDAGLRKNVEIHRQWRDAVGPDFPLMVDCYMSLTVPYAIELCTKLSQIGLKWMEEYLMPDDYAGHIAVKDALKSTPTLLATAEHEYTRYGYRQLIDSGCVDVLQPDITWLGGITEARRVISMASAANLAVIPHGSSVFSYHVVAASQNCPMSEFVTPQLDSIVGYFGGLFDGEPLPKNGFVTIPDEPGFGLTLIRDGLRRVYDRPVEESLENAKATRDFRSAQPARMRL
eukprot:SAG31_NODE_2810_length_5061_cov_12.226522_6_plen_309_part_00